MVRKTVTNRDLVTTVAAKYYMQIPKRLRKYVKPIAKQAVKTERSVTRATTQGNKQLRSEVTTRTKRLVGIGKTFTSAFGSSGNVKKKRSE